MMKHLLLFSLCLPLLATAQQQEQKKYLRFIPLGERPTYGETVTAEVRIANENAPGSVPPSDVSIATSGKDATSFNLRLREFTPTVSLKTSAGGIKMTEGKTPGGKAFLTSRFPAKPHTLAVLYRDNKDMTWFKPKMMVLPEDLSSFPHGKIRFVNTSEFEVAVKFGAAKPFAVKPGRTVYKTLKVGQTQAAIAVKNKAGVYKEIMKNSIVMNPRQRIQAFIYKAQGATPKKPVKLLMKPETFQAPRSR